MTDTVEKLTRDSEGIKQRVGSIRKGKVTRKLSTLCEFAVWCEGKVAQGKVHHGALVRRTGLMTQRTQPRGSGNLEKKSRTKLLPFKKQMLLCWNQK